LSSLAWASGVIVVSVGAAGAADPVEPAGGAAEGASVGAVAAEPADGAPEPVVGVGASPAPVARDEGGREGDPQRGGGHLAPSLAQAGAALLPDAAVQ
jgi:hypothetical protein